MTDQLLNQETKFMTQLKKFIVDNGIIGTTAGVSIALASKDLISSLVGDIIIPAISLLTFKLNIKWLNAILPGKTVFDVTSFSKHTVSWIFIMIITFIFIKTAFETILGANSPTNAAASPATTTATATATTNTNSKAKESFYFRT
jgi:large-conductance mechanosensitive channel